MSILSISKKKKFLKLNALISKNSNSKTQATKVKFSNRPYSKKLRSYFQQSQNKYPNVKLIVKKSQNNEKYEKIDLINKCLKKSF